MTRDLTTQLYLHGRHSASLRQGCVAGAVALLGASVTMVAGDTHLVRQFMFSYLVSFMFYLSICLGALFMILVHHLTGARWSVVLRRLNELVAMNFPLMFILFLPIAFMLPRLYPWMDAAAVAADPLLEGKRAFLNPGFFLLRAAVYFAVWSALAWRLYSLSVRQDRDDDPRLSARLQRLSAPGMILFALTTTFASFDWMMSLDPKWYSTIFGVYYFGGAVLAILATLVLMTLALQTAGRMQGVISTEHLHDLGKLMFAFVVFWAYIAFSQFLLIWMADIPEETVWFAHRWDAAGWMALSLVLVFFHFIFLFMFLLPRTVKRCAPLMVLAAVWVMAVHYLDLYWIIMPAFEHHHVPLHPVDLFLWLGLGCLFVHQLVGRAKSQALAPAGDPHLAESVAFENV